MELELLKEFCLEKIKEHPHLKSEITDFYDLCRDEIADGGSVWNEIHLCKESINQLIQEQG